MARRRSLKNSNPKSGKKSTTGRRCRKCKGHGQVPRKIEKSPFSFFGGPSETIMETCSGCQGRGHL